MTYVNDVKSLLHGSLSGEREAGVDLSGDLAWDNLEDLATELDEQAVKGGVDLVILVLSVLLSILDGCVDQLCVLWHLGRGENERRVGGGILGLVLGDRAEVSRVTDDGLS